MQDSSKKVYEKARENKTYLRIGAFILALERIQEKL
jgi:glutamate dehydrogenase/leucine dehydrogenase